MNAAAPKLADLPSTEQAVKNFRARFGASPRLFQAPGRINIIGEHTDYCGGLAMPAAIDRWCRIAIAGNGSRRLTLIAEGFGEAGLDLDTLKPRGDWSDYVAGVAKVLLDAGVAVPGADLRIESNVPVGAGVSSSAAIEVATAQALLGLAGGDADGLQVARWSQRAENDFVGMPCGIMDQYASANGIENAALVLDCARLTSSPAPLPANAAFILIDSGVRHAHVDGAYRDRRADCETAARLLGVNLLAEVSEADLPAALPRLASGPAKRCRHVVTETARVRRGAAALADGDLAALGLLMNQSHASLRDDMEVSTPEVDRLADIAGKTPGVFGARMMGGGFGGCIIALADRARAATAMASIVKAYGAPTAFICRAVAGAGEVAP